MPVGGVPFPNPESFNLAVRQLDGIVIKALRAPTADLVSIMRDNEELMVKNIFVCGCLTLTFF